MSSVIQLADRAPEKVWREVEPRESDEIDEVLIHALEESKSGESVKQGSTTDRAMRKTMCARTGDVGTMCARTDDVGTMCARTDDAYRDVRL